MKTSSTPDPLIVLSGRIDVEAAREELARNGRTQIAPILTSQSALRLRKLLEVGTPWGVVWRAGGMAAPKLIRADQVARVGQNEVRSMHDELLRSMGSNDYAFCYSTYPLVQALLEAWNPGGEHEQLLEDLNAPEILKLIRAISGIEELVKADGQATLYRPGQFLARHNDEESKLGRRIAYVLNLCGDPAGRPWRAEWGGTLQFLDDDGSPNDTFLPRFNALNLFTVPQWHHVTSVAAFAPSTRYCITGWFRDRI